MNINGFEFNEDNTNSSFDSTNRDSILNKLLELRNSQSFTKLTDSIRNIVSIIICISMCISLWSFYNISVKHSSEPLFVRIFFYITIAISITLICSIIKSSTLLYFSHVIEDKMNVYNCTDDDLARNEKTARLILAVCDFLNSLIPNLFTIILGGAFIIAGVYFGLFAGENSQLGFLFIFPLMGLGAIIASSLPTIRCLKLIIAIKKEDEYSIYENDNASSFNSKRLLSIISGLVFLFSGLFCIITGIVNFGTDKEMIDKIGFILFGIPFGAIGTFLIIANNKFN